MRTLATIILGGAGLLAADAAVAAGADKAHVMNVALPDGSVARIHDVGDVAPKVMVARAVPVALFDRMAADMDRQRWRQRLRYRGRS
jgi:hypothetical protein